MRLSKAPRCLPLTLDSTHVGKSLRGRRLQHDSDVVKGRPGWKRCIVDIQYLRNPQNPPTLIRLLCGSRRFVTYPDLSVHDAVVVTRFSVTSVGVP